MLSCSKCDKSSCSLQPGLHKVFLQRALTLGCLVLKTLDMPPHALI